MSFLMKDPGASLDYAVDWGLDYLDGDVLLESSWAILPEEPGGLALVESAFDGLTATAKVAGGVNGRVYRLTNEVLTASGRRDRRSLMLRVEKR
jgi:hypothetical protein